MLILLQIFLTFLKLGLTSFGGPMAHLGFFHNEFVLRKKWINENEYADLVALCQLLPGPASSQVGMAIGFYRGGIFGSILAWLAFTLPSALLLIFFALSLTSFPAELGNGWLHGLKIAAVAVVAQAVWEMFKKFCNSPTKICIALLTAFFCFYIQSVSAQIGLIVVGALWGFLFLRPALSTDYRSRQIKFNALLSSTFLIIFFILLIVLPFAAMHSSSLEIKLADVFYRLGALVFGGGHVVLPLIKTSVVDSGWVTKEAFIAGYGAAQAVPGPLFSLSAYLGFMSHQWLGAIISLIMIFLPSFLLIIGILPYWEKIRSYKQLRAALVGVNSVVVGLLLAALYNPVWTAAIFTWKDFALALVGFFLLTFKNTPSYLIVAALAVITALPFY